MEFESKTSWYQFNLRWWEVSRPRLTLYADMLFEQQNYVDFKMKDNSHCTYWVGVIISAKLVLVNEKNNSSSSASPAYSCVSLSKGNLFFFIIILTTTTTYRLPNQDKAGDPKGHHCCKIYRMGN